VRPAFGKRRPTAAVEPLHDRVTTRVTTDVREVHDSVVATWEPEYGVAVNEGDAGRVGIKEPSKPSRSVFGIEPDAVNVGLRVALDKRRCAEVAE